jgi:hypothetical protein
VGLFRGRIYLGDLGSTQHFGRNLGGLVHPVGGSHDGLDSEQDGGVKGERERERERESV